MKSLAKHLLLVAIPVLILIASAPTTSAQVTEIQRVLQLNPGGYLGIQMEDVTSRNMSRYKLNEERGVIIRSVMKNSPAEEAGLKEDDVLLEFGGIQVWSAVQLSRLVQETPPGRNVNLVISRDGKKMNLKVQIGQRGSKISDVAPELFEGRSFRFGIPDSPVPRPGDTAGRRPRLGVTLQPLTSQMGEFLGVPGQKGVLVVSVDSGSPSAGKLQAGDVIVSADGKSVDDPEDLTRIVRDKGEGSLSLRVIRNKKEITVVIDLPADEREGRGLKL